jgi:hypothetical protein
MSAAAFRKIASSNACCSSAVPDLAVTPRTVPLCADDHAMPCGA